MPGGANLRNVWTIATHSFKEAHFATFPPALVEPCIKAGTSERGVCGECGAPWVRETEVLPYEKRADGSIGNREVGTYQGNPSVAKRTKTTGWSPPCECRDAEQRKRDDPYWAPAPHPATVLDPFAGAGTVGLVAARLQRDAILIEISPEYAEMARRRIADDAPMFAEVSA